MTSSAATCHGGEGEAVGYVEEGRRASIESVCSRDEGGGRGRQFIALFTCQRCRRKKRKRRPPEALPEVIDYDRNELRDTSLDQLRNPSPGLTDRETLAAGRRTKRRTPTSSTKIDEIKRRLTSLSERKSTPGLSRSNETSPACATPGYHIRASILKNRNTPSPLNTHSPESSSRQSTGNYETLAIPSHSRRRETSGDRRGNSSILARSAKLKNEAGYGSFSFQSHEFGRLFDAAVEPDLVEEVGSGADDDDDDRDGGFNLYLKPISSDCSGGSAASSSGGSPRDDHNLASEERRTASNASGVAGKRRARFNEAVRVIVDDRRSGRPIVGDCVKLKQDSEHGLCATSRRGHGSNDVITAGGDWFRKRVMSADSGTSSYAQAADAAAARCRRAATRHRSSHCEAHMEIERRPSDPTASGAKQSSSRSTQSLRVVIRLGTDVSRERVFVRTARNGTCLLVGTYRPEPLGDGTNYLHQLIDRYRLPRPVYVPSVKADLGDDGNLAITAQIATDDDEDDDYDLTGS